MNARSKSVFKDKIANECFSSLRAKYVVIPAEEASSNLVVCKYYNGCCLVKELCFSKNSGYPTYKHTRFCKPHVINVIKACFK